MKKNSQGLQNRYVYYFTVAIIVATVFAVCGFVFENNQSLVVQSAYAQGDEVSPGANTRYGLDTAATRSTLVPDTGSTSNLQTTIGRIIKPLIGFSGTIFLVLIIIAGTMWMTAGGNDERVAKAKKILRSAVIGLVIVIFAYGFVALIGRLLIDDESSGTTGSTGFCTPGPCPSGFVQDPAVTCATQGEIYCSQQ